MMTNSESFTTSVENTTAVPTPCLICGDTVSIASYYMGSKICDKCKEAVLHVRQKLELNPLAAVSDTCPCNGCKAVWARLSGRKYESCEDTCEEFAKWRKAKKLEQLRPKKTMPGKTY